MRKIKSKPSESTREKYIAIGAGMGVVAGAVIGQLFEDSGLWISICIAIGVGIGATLGKKSPPSDEV